MEIGNSNDIIYGLLGENSALHFSCYTILWGNPGNLNKKIEEETHVRERYQKTRNANTWWSWEFKTELSTKMMLFSLSKVGQG